MAWPNPASIAIAGTRPYFEAKLKDGAIASVAQLTGTFSRATFATGAGATTTQLSQALGALLQDLQTRGIIK